MVRNALVAIALLCGLVACRQDTPQPQATFTPRPTVSPIAVPSFRYTPTPVLVPTPTPTAAVFTPTPTDASPSDPPPVGNNASSGSITGNGSAGGVIVSVVTTPSPTPAPTATPTFAPKILTYMDVGNGSVIPTSTQATAWATYMQDIGVFSGNLESICVGTCQLVHYMDFWKAEANANGNDTSFPFHSTNGNYHGTCPGSAGANFFTAGIDDETWYLHATGTSAAIKYRIASFLSSNSTYIWMMNPGSTTLQQFIANTVANCYWNNNSTYYPFSKHHIFIDNTKWRPSIGWSEWGPGQYNTQTNIGSYQSGGPPYAAGTSCTTQAALYSGAYCTTTTQTSATGNATLEYGTNDTQFISDMNTLLSGMKSNAVDGGGCVGAFVNGFIMADPSLVANSCVLGGVSEKTFVDTGTHGSQSVMESTLDGLAMINQQYPSKVTLVEDTSPGTGTQAIGNAAEEFAKRMHYAAVWVGGYPNIVDQPYLDTAVSGANYIFPASYLVPQWSSAYQTMAVPSPIPCGTETGVACTGGGSHDITLCHGTHPNCFYVREFAHCSYNSAFDSTTAGTNLGPCAVGWNLTSGGVAESTFSGYFAHWSSYGHIIAFCGTPNGSYITGGTFSTGTTVVGAGCGDTANGGGMDFTTLLKSSFTGTLAQYDAIFLVQ